MPTAGYALDLFTPKLEEDESLPTRPVRDHSLATAEMMRPRYVSDQGERDGLDPLISRRKSANRRQPSSERRRAAFEKLSPKYSEPNERAMPHFRNSSVAERASHSTASPASSPRTRIGGYSVLPGHSISSSSMAHFELAGHRAADVHVSREQARQVPIDRDSVESTATAVSPVLPPPTRSCLSTEGVDASLLARALLAASDATAYLESEAHAKALERVSNAAASESPDRRAEHRAALRSGARRNAQHRRMASSRAATDSETSKAYSPVKHSSISSRARTSSSVDRPGALDSLSLSPSPRKHHDSYRHSRLQQQQQRSSPPLSPAERKGQHLLRSPSPGADRAGALLEHHQRLVRLLDDGNNHNGDGNHDSVSSDQRGSSEGMITEDEIPPRPAIASKYPEGRPASSLKSSMNSPSLTTKIHSPTLEERKPRVHAPQQPQKVQGMLLSAQLALEGLSTPVSPRRATNEEERGKAYEVLSPLRLNFHQPPPVPQQDSTTPTGSPPRRSPAGSTERNPTPPRPVPLKPPPIPPPPRSSASASASERFI